MTSSTATRTLTVALPGRPKRYPIVVGPAGVSRLGETLAGLLPRGCKVLVLSDDNVWPLYGEAVRQSLSESGFQPLQLSISSGESHKTLQTAEAVFQQAVQLGLSRRDAMLALGGGVMGDLTGFCAATFHRGIHFVQVPTTLLAQVDASVGGKVAVNFQDVKNGVGAFYQPDAVIADTDTLSSLPEREMLAGMAEIVKYGFIQETALGELVRDETDLLRVLSKLPAHWVRQPDTLSEVIELCCRMKAAVVGRDETESPTNEDPGGRVCLNLGHTFAHAYEALTQYEVLLHGEAVALGMRLAFATSQVLQLLPGSDVVAANALMDALSLPQRPPSNVQPEQVVAMLRKDKKTLGGKVRLILPEGHLGRVIIRQDVPDSLLLEVVQRFHANNP
jgi:3-dehydroquinate synthase